MHPKHLRIEDFTYELPDHRIARFPLEQRDASKLLVYRQGNLAEDVYTHLPAYLPPQTTLVFNNTKVVEARLQFEKTPGSFIEIFCLEPADIYPDITTAMLQKQEVLWKCLVGGAKKWKTGELALETSAGNALLRVTADKVEKQADFFLVRLRWNLDLSFAEVLHYAGALPLPPYLNRQAEASDRERYQTVYAAQDGSVAAPTAGLHFTPALLKELEAKDIRSTFVTLHVGAGTFRPVKAETIEGHDMHAEFIDVGLETIEQLLLAEKIVAVGTTSLRTIETLYWIGVRLHTLQVAGNAPDGDDLLIRQWDAYELPQDIPKETALQQLVIYLRQHQIDRLITKTQILIAPPYRLRVANALLTNFHQPQSTLLLLVAAITGNDWKNIYRYAMDNGFRFLSYGDGCLLNYSL
jgi:S-adenosylmethionine:tRNA ribosyltransferase-isomerase